MSSTLRCLRVLELLADHPYEFTLSDITQRLAIAKGSAHRLVSTLGESGLVEQDPKTRQYRLAPKAFWVGTGWLRHSDVYRAASPLMQEITGRGRGMAHLGVWHDGTVLYLHTISHLDFPYVFAEAGERRPVHCTALGKVLLAHRPPEELKSLAARGFRRYTEQTITTLVGIRRELALIRDQGYALDAEELVRGVRCIAVAIRDRMGKTVAAISMSAPASVLDEQEVPRCAAIVAEAGLRASVQLGYRPGTSNLASLIPRRPQPEQEDRTLRPLPGALDPKEH